MGQMNAVEKDEANVLCSLHTLHVCWR